MTVSERQVMNESKLNSGFTLLELVISVSVIVILTGVTAPGLNKYIEKAREQRYIAEAKSVCQAAQLYIIDREMIGNPISQEQLARELTDIEVSSKSHVLYPYLTQRATMNAEIKWVITKNQRLTEITYQVNGYEITVKTTGEVKIVNKGRLHSNSALSKKGEEPAEEQQETIKETE